MHAHGISTSALVGRSSSVVTSQHTFRLQTYDLHVHRRDEKCIRTFLIKRRLRGRVVDGRILLKRSRRNRHDGVNWIQLLRNRVEWWDFLNTMINLHIPRKRSKFLIIWVTMYFSRRFCTMKLLNVYWRKNPWIFNGECGKSQRLPMVSMNYTDILGSRIFSVQTTKFKSSGKTD
jgi:hypothetical protein